MMGEAVNICFKAPRTGGKLKAWEGFLRVEDRSWMAEAGNECWMGDGALEVWTRWLAGKD